MGRTQKGAHHDREVPVSIDLNPFETSEWWLVVFTSEELATGEARYAFPLSAATGGAIVHTKHVPFEAVRAKWKIDPEHMHAYQLQNREADAVAVVERLLTPKEAVRLWNRYATDKRP
jgi:hypothetical protein